MKMTMQILSYSEKNLIVGSFFRTYSQKRYQNHNSFNIQYVIEITRVPAVENSI